MVLTRQQRMDLAYSLPELTWLDDELVMDTTGRALLEAMSDEQLADACWELQQRFAPNLLDHGGQRSVYCFDEQSVVKIPLVSASGIDPTRYQAYSVELVRENAHANLLEAAYYEQDEFGYPVAPCYVVWHESGVPIVVQEYVAMRAPHTSDLPDWAMEVDGGQVGWSALLGCWAAYDAGCPTRDSAIYREYAERIELATESEYRRIAA